MAEWRINEAMARKGIKNAGDLHRRLLAAGFTRTKRSVRRIVETPPKKVDIEFLVHLVKVLDCRLEALVVLSSPEKSGSDSPAQQLEPSGLPVTPGQNRKEKTEKASQSLYALNPGNHGKVFSIIPERKVG